MNVLRRFLGVALLLCLVTTASAQNKPQRGPSTPEERKTAVEIATYLENHPLAKDAKDKRAVLLGFLVEVPDVNVYLCTAVFGSEKEFKGDYQADLLVQSSFSQAKFIIENPGKATDKGAIFLAGVEGTLRTWSAIKAEKPKAKFPLLDVLLEKQKNGTLAEHVAANSGKCQ